MTTTTTARYENVEPRIKTCTLLLDLTQQDAALPTFVAHVTLMRHSVIVNVGSPEHGLAISQDMSCAMPPINSTTIATRATATNLSLTSSSAQQWSTTLSAKLGTLLTRSELTNPQPNHSQADQRMHTHTATRYKQQVYLSLDLSAINKPGQSIDRVWSTIEQSLVKALDKVLR
ncbi:hypothetical protein OIO90_003472 [Microbotryomycetes sp. JL221]|nr:hypothetical protein OIO90_003472 [Microbotryomycetes sp. JL221]